MHDDAGRKRRRRMVLLNLPGPLTQLPALSQPAPTAVLCANDEYLASLDRGPMPELCVQDWARQPLRVQPLTGPALLLGRGPDNDLRLNHNRIQPRHLVLLRLPGGVFFVVASPEAEVLGPSGPVDAGWWTPGLCLTTGSYRLRMNGLPHAFPAGDPLAVSSDLASELPHLELKFLDGTAPNRPWPLTRPLTLIGRSPLCRIRLEHNRILPLQAAIIRHAGRLWLINFGAPDQVRVNEQPTAFASADIGDVMRVGDFRMEIQAAAEWFDPVSPRKSVTSSANVEGLLKQLADQQQRMLETQQAALAELSRLAETTTDPALLRAVLEKIQASYAALGRDHSEMQARLQAQLKRPAE
jgi:hypothetical protein